MNAKQNRNTDIKRKQRKIKKKGINKIKSQAGCWLSNLDLVL